jgi:altronate hydrolase
MQGYPRQDGRKGIRNIVLVAYLVECAHHVAREIVAPWREEGVHLIGFPGCFHNEYADRIMRELCTHPNVGAVLLVSLGCEGFARDGLTEAIAESGRPVETVVIQQAGGTRRSIDAGRAWVERARAEVAVIEPVDMRPDELVVGTICGGSDATSGVTANPAVGRAFDRLVQMGVTCIFEETGELIGCEHHMAARAATPELGQRLIDSVAKAARFYRGYGQGSFAPGNAEGGLTTIEEKSLGAYCKSGTARIAGMILPGERPPGPGLYLLDVVPDAEPRFGFPNITDNAEICELMACGAHVTLFTTGRGSVVGSAIAPVIKICANPETYARLADDMDINAGRILPGEATVDEVGREIVDRVIRVAAGERTVSEQLGHREFLLTYKAFQSLSAGRLLPECHPGRGLGNV